MIAVIVLYYFLMLRFSEVEYREVISEKFGEQVGGGHGDLELP